jgi:ABC-2 type transport system permease protein
MRTFVSAWAVALRIVALNFRAQLEYRADFWLTVALGVAWQASIIVFATVLLGRFPAMGGWPSDAVLLIASMRMLSHGLFELCFGRTVEMAITVQEGRIDGFLLRPMPVYRQLQLSQFNSNVIGDLLVGVSMFTAAVASVDLEWTPLHVAYITAALIGGTLMEGAIFTALSSLHLHFPSSLAWTYWIEELMSTFGNYPLRILPGVAAGMFTLVIPLAFIAYLPVAVLTGNDPGLGLPRLIAVASPLIGLGAYIGSRALWNASLRRYTGING